MDISKKNIELILLILIDAITSSITERLDGGNCMKDLWSECMYLAGLWAVLNNAGTSIAGGPIEWQTVDDYKKVK